MKNYEGLSNISNDWFKKCEINKKINFYEKELRNMKFINDVLNGLPVADAAKKYMITRQYGYKILNNIKSNKNKFRGRPCKLNSSQIEKLIKYLNKKSYFTVKDVREFIKINYNVVYCNKEIVKILNNYGFKYYSILKCYSNKKNYERLIDKIFS